MKTERALSSGALARAQFARPMLGPCADRLRADRRLQRAIAHVHRCGPRPVAELIVHLLDTAAADSVVLDLVLGWTRLDPETVAKVGGHEFPPPPLDIVPKEIREET